LIYLSDNAEALKLVTSKALAVGTKQNSGTILAEKSYPKTQILNFLPVVGISGSQAFGYVPPGAPSKANAVDGLFPINADIVALIGIVNILNCV
jgi:hypothetical protein